MTNKKIYEFVVTDKYGVGFILYMIMKESYKYDEVHIITDKFNSDKARVVLLLLYLHGWQKTEESPIQKTVSKYRCVKCKKSFNAKEKNCPKCSSIDFTSYSMLSTRVMVERVGGFQARLEEVMDSKKYKEEFEWVKIREYMQKAEDALILKRDW